MPPGRTEVVLTLAGDLHVLAELAGLALDLNTVMEVLFESGTVEDTVAGRARVVDNELVLSSSFTSSGLGLEKTLQKREKEKNPD